jgi:hypothetical protein
LSIAVVVFRPEGAGNGLEEEAGVMEFAGISGVVSSSLPAHPVNSSRAIIPRPFFILIIVELSFFGKSVNM